MSFYTLVMIFSMNCKYMNLMLGHALIITYATLLGVVFMSLLMFTVCELVGSALLHPFVLATTSFLLCL